ncbi:MAG: SLC13 family permease [Chloroflexota bacterium]
MTPETGIVTAMLVLPLALIFLGRWRVDVAGLFMIVALGVAQFLGVGVLGRGRAPEEALLAISGFGEPLVLILIGLFILTHALSRNGVMLWLGSSLAAAAQQSVRRLIFLFTFSAALLALLMNNVAVGSLLLPSAIQASRKNHVRPSRLLIPIAFGTALGGMATYFTTANIVMSQLLTIAEPPQEPLNVLSFAPVGGLIAVLGIAYLAFFGYRLVPARRPGPEQLLARRASDELEGLYEVSDRLWEARVGGASSLVGCSLQTASLGERLGIAVVAMRRGYQAYFAPAAEEMIREGDVFLVVGREERVQQLASMEVNVKAEAHTITNFGLTLVEFILAPHSVYAGKSIKELAFRSRYGFTVLAIQRGGHSYRTDVGTMALQRGDALLIVGPAGRVRELHADPELIIFEPDPATRSVPRRRALASIVVFAGALVLAIIGLPIYLAVLAAAFVAVVGGFVSLRDAYRSIEWEIIIFVAGMHAASLAMINTGIAARLGAAAIDLLGGVAPLGLAAAAFVAAAALTQFMGSQSASFLVGPITISAALELHADPHAIAVATAMGCSAAFLTPIAHPVNLIMMGPGNHRFGDFFKVGAGLMLVAFLALLLGMVLFWGL